MKTLGTPPFHILESLSVCGNPATEVCEIPGEVSVFEKLRKQLLEFGKTVDDVT